ncbi:hypothetical protein ABH892_002041 [Paenibacillus sp. RC254]
MHITGAGQWIFNRPLRGPYQGLMDELNYNF